MKHVAILVDGEIVFSGDVTAVSVQKGRCQELNAGAVAVTATYRLAEQRREAPS